MGKTKVITEAGAGQHGVYNCNNCSFALDLSVLFLWVQKECTKQELNVFRMKLLGAKVVAVEIEVKL